MGRSIKKGPFRGRSFDGKDPEAQCYEYQETDQDLDAPLDDYTEFVGHTFNVHNGKVFNPVL